MRLWVTVFLGLSLGACGRFEQKSRESRDPVDAASTAEILVLGDSLSTGAVTHPEFHIDYANLVTRALKGERFAPKASLIDESASADEILKTPKRVGDPKSEVAMFGSASVEAAASALLKAIEWPELSWEGQLARKRGLDARHVVVAARNGARSSQASDQVAAWLDSQGSSQEKQLPKDVYIFFSGNDLCRDAEAASDMTPPLQYAAGIRDSVRALAQKAKAHDGGTTVHLVSHLDVLQLARNPDLMAKKRIKVRDGGPTRELSCTEFLKEHQIAGSSAGPQSALARFSYHPMNLCQNVLAHTPGLDAAQAKVPMAKLEEQMAAYRSSLRELAGELAQDPELAQVQIKVDLLRGTEEVKLVPEDLASDCFHLSAKGQSKITKAVMGQL